nr:PREDICTED: ZW10 interactor-like [Lepisosteus oculatus]
MAAEQAKQVLQQCEAALGDVLPELVRQDELELPASVKVPFLMDSREKHKVLVRQLWVLDSLLSLLETLDTSTLSEGRSSVDTGTEDRDQWKALKSQYKDEIQEVESLITVFKEKVDEVLARKEALCQLLHTLEQKKEECKEKQRIKAGKQQKARERAERVCARVQELEAALERGRHGLQLSGQRVSELQAQLSGAQQSLDTWSRAHSRLQLELQRLDGLSGVRVLSVRERELHVELNPRLLCPSLDLLPLSLSLRWTSDDLFTLQLSSAGRSLLEDVSSRRPLQDARSALLEVMQLYVEQGSLLAEIQRLHSRFAIDWRPAERKLVFLKTASIVCTLSVEEGYPTSGRVQLVSVQGGAQSLNIAGLQPPLGKPSLTEWLEFLTCCPDL